MSYNEWLYTYANPINLTDPSGHDPWWCEETQNSTACYYQWVLSHAGLSGMLTAEQCASITQSKIEPGDFLITHYYMPIESDSYFQTAPYSQKVNVKISDPNGSGMDLLGPYHWGEQRRYNFMFGPLGVAKQGGTGITDTGRYIAPDWTVDKKANNNVDQFHFVYTEGGSCRYMGLSPSTGKTVAADLSIYRCGTQFIIDEYPGTVFTVADSGGAIGPNHLDIYIGALYYSQYQWLTKTAFKSTVRMLK